jgi:uncharacterized membrane protein
MTTRTRARPQWRVPAGLIALSLVPVLAGAVRVAQLTVGAPITPDNARFFASPVPILLHIVGATGYCVLGAFQFVPSLRRSNWHRRTGRLVVLCGLTTALSGLWLAPGEGSALLVALRIAVGTAMATAIVLGVMAIRGHDVRTHRAWMIRAYAIGIGAGSQAVITAAWFAAAGAPGELTRELLLGAGWALNLAVAEMIIRRETR